MSGVMEGVLTGCCGLTHAVTLVAGAVALLLFGVYWYGYRGYSLLNTLNLPGPKPRGFVGNLPDVKKAGGLHAFQLECRKKYGKIFTMCLGRRVSIAVAEPEILKQIMVKEFPNFINRFSVVRPVHPINKAVLLERDENWKRIRSTLTPTFSSAKLKQMLSLIDAGVNTLLTKADEIADTGKSVDMHEWFSQMTLDVILSTAFGVEADVQTNPDAEMLQKSKAIFRRPQTFVRFLLALPFGSVFRFLFLHFKSSFQYFPKLAAGIIKMRREQAKKGIVGRNDLLRLMLAAQEEAGSEGETGRLTDDEIVAQCVIFLLAGHETSSNTLAFVAYHLALNPDIQDKLRFEIESAVESNPDMPMYELIQSIEYLDCVINESQRLCPPVFNMNRECKNACTINGVHFPAGIEVVIPFYVLHNDPDVWPDVDRFDPDRFMGPNKDKIPPYQFMPFGAGPRVCIGMRFALVEIKLTLVKFLRKYKFVRSPETQVPLALHSGVTLTARDGVHVRLESIES